MADDTSMSLPYGICLFVLFVFRKCVFDVYVHTFCFIFVYGLIQWILLDEEFAQAYI